MLYIPHIHVFVHEWKCWPVFSQITYVCNCTDRKLFEFNCTDYKLFVIDYKLCLIYFIIRISVIVGIANLGKEAFSVL